MVTKTKQKQNCIASHFEILKLNCHSSIRVAHKPILFENGDVFSMPFRACILHLADGPMLSCLTYS